MRAAFVAAAAVAAVVAGAAVLAGSGDEPPAARAAAATARVQRTTLTDRERVDGTLGYADERDVAGRLPGTVTWLPSEGAVVRPGGTLARVDGEPIVLLDGAVPAWRALSSGDEGEDVAQLERGLRDLGFDPGEVDGEFDADTADAVRDWQDDRGLEETGRVELGRVVFLPGTRRVTSRRARLGGAAAGPLLVTTSTRRIVTIDLDAADQAIAREGARADVELPDGSVVRGAVARVGRVAQAGSGEDGPTVEVVVRLLEPEHGRRLDRAPASVELARERRRDVLAVPVTALVARRGGGYAVEVVAGGRTRLVPVEPGLLADGLAAVRGAGLREGQQVVVPEDGS